jgi:gliding motility-associated-like protein
VVTLILNVREVYDLAFSTTICQGESFVWNDIFFDNPGDYPVMFSSVYGCDSLVTLQLTVVEAFETSEALAICEGEVLSWNQQELSDQGEYLAELQSVNGCDSLVTLSLQVNPVYSFSLQESICEGEAFELNGESFSETGTYQQLFTTAAGCDSLITLGLTVNPIESSTLPVTLCGVEVFTLDGVVYDTPGTYEATLTASTGCDSLVTLEITARPEYLTELFDTLCVGQQVAVGAQVFSEAGVYDVMLASEFGCDSLVTLNLHYLPEDYFDLYFPNVFTPNGDDKNDTFGLEGTLEFADDYSLLIYSRWGSEVFSADRPEQRWDGKAGSGQAPEGVYYYIARFMDNCTGSARELTGYVTLLE